MVGFTKLHGLILDSSIWLESTDVRIVWITMMAMADKDGVVQASIGGLAARARVDREACVQALAILAGPDPDSRDGTTGERIEKTEGGWVLLNHANYRDKQTREQRLTADRVRRHRDGRRGDEATTAGATGGVHGNGYVYYAADGSGLCKIGFSVNPWARISEHRVANPAIELVVIERGDLFFEGERHKQFAALRADVNGSREWFKLEGSLRTHIEELLRRSGKEPKATTALRSTTKRVPASVYVPAAGTSGTTPSKPEPAPSSTHTRTASQVAPRPDDVAPELWQAFKANRSAKRKPLTKVAWTLIANRIDKAGVTATAALTEAIENGWADWKSAADWPRNRAGAAAANGNRGCMPHTGFADKDYGESGAF